MVIDVQRDFCEGGALAVPNTLSLLQPLQDCVEKARNAGLIIVFTQDWHPSDHRSFESSGGPWPVHCVAGSRGAELAPPVAARSDELVVRKGTTRLSMGYSAFEGTPLAESLRRQRVTRIGICGLATEYCVRATALDALQCGFQVTVLEDLVRPIDQAKAREALGELERSGVLMASSDAWLGEYLRRR